MNMLPKLFAVFLVIVQFSCKTFARESVWGLKLTQTNTQFTLLPNYMFEDSFVTVFGSCESSVRDATVEVQWVLLEIDCMEEMYKTQTKTESDMFNLLFQAGGSALEVNNSTYFETWLEDVNSNASTRGISFRFQFSHIQRIGCVNKQLIMLKDESNEDYFKAIDTDENMGNGHSRRKYTVVDIMKKPDSSQRKVSSRVARAWDDGMYHFFIRVAPVSNISYTANVIVEMRGHYGFLSAIEWPLLPISGAMSLLYLTAGSVWIILWAKAQEHSHKIHIVIGAVAVAGGLGNTLCFIDLSVRNSDGVGLNVVMWIGKLVSTCQLSLTQLLLMIVSTGYGINRPALTRQYVNIMATIAALSFVANAALITVSSESLKIKYQQPWLFTIVLVIFSLVLVLVTGWIMMFAINTFIYLFQRRHSSKTKLTIFCVFMGCCITVFATNLGIGIYNLSSGLMRDCLQDWKHEWVWSTVSQVQMFGLLVVLMWLWRPVDENKSYAFHPISTDEAAPDGNSDGEENEKIFLEKM